MNRKLSIIIPYKHGDKLRIEAMRELMKSIKNQTYTNFETIIVEEISHPLEFGLCEYRNDIDKYIVLKNDKPFNKSWCINVGIKSSSTDDVIIIDADSIFDKDYFNAILKYINKGNLKFFHAYDWIILMPGKDNPVIRIVPHKDILSTGGGWYCNRDYFFNELGGMNENYFGYGREDSDLWVRATFKLNTIPELKYTLTHLYHDWAIIDKSNEQWLKNGGNWNYTRGHVEEVINKLKSVNLGDNSTPTLIKMGNIDE